MCVCVESGSKDVQVRELDRHVAHLNGMQETGIWVPKFPTCQRAAFNNVVHWLPVAHQVDYTISIVTFKAQRGLAPSCISDLLSPLAP